MKRQMGFLALWCACAVAVTASAGNDSSGDMASSSEVAGFDILSMKSNNYSAPSDTNDPNGLILLQGMEYVSSRASEEHDALLNDGNYFLQLYYSYRLPGRWDHYTAGASAYFQKDFVISNATKVAKENQTPNLNQIVKADVIGMFLNFIFDPDWQVVPLFLRINLGGEMARDADENMDDTFNWKSDAAIGVETTNGLSTFDFEIGYGHYEMLPENDWRSICGMTYTYDLSKKGLAGKVQLSVEFNGIEHSGEEQARINVAYQMDPERLFTALAGIFVDKPIVGPKDK